jgi:hypothetical protein
VELATIPRTPGRSTATSAHGCDPSDKTSEISGGFGAKGDEAGTTYPGNNEDGDEGICGFDGEADEGNIKNPDFEIDGDVEDDGTKEEEDGGDDEDMWLVDRI